MVQSVTQAEQALAYQTALQDNLNPSVFMAMLATESGWNPNIVNSQGSGAEGVAQIMPSTAAQPGYGIAPISNPFDYKQAIPFAGQVLKAFGGTTPQGIQKYGTATIGSQNMADLLNGVAPNGVPTGYAAIAGSNPAQTAQPATASGGGIVSTIGNSVGNVLAGMPSLAPLGLAIKVATAPKGSGPSSLVTDGVLILIGLGLIYLALHKQINPVIVTAAKASV